jgi:Fic family protein
MQFTLNYTHHLVSLVAETTTLAGRLLDVAEHDLQAAQRRARREAARWSARLDASPLEPGTVAAVDACEWQRPALTLPDERAGGWASALRLDTMETQDVAAVEYDNLCRAYDAEPELAEELFDQPLQTLARLHGVICEGLVAPEVIGRPRRTEQAVHDGAQGMVIFNAPDHESLPGLLQALQRWLRGEDGEGSAAYPGPVLAAVVHERLLQWQPFEAGNGRLARAAARLVLRARGVDPHGLAVPERLWAADSAGYYGEVAATMRRRDDLGPWVERHLETLQIALTESVAALREPLRPPSARALELVGQLEAGAAVTVAEYAARAGISRETAWRDLHDLMIAGHVIRESKSLGRRFRRV